MTFDSQFLPAYFFLSVDVFLVILQAISIIGNGLIIYLFYSDSRIRRNLSLRLLLTLSLTNFLFAVLDLPSIVYFLAKWNPIELNYSGTLVIIFEIPLMFQLKIYLLITTAIALDRVQAMRFALYYRKKRPMTYVYQTVSLGLLLASLDMLCNYGCFASPQFKKYWGLSNIAVNVFMLAITCFATFEVHNYRRDRCGNHASEDENEANKTNKTVVICENLTQTNRLAMGILIISVLFLTIPCTFAGLLDIFYEGISNNYNYSIGLLLAGIFNSIVYMVFHIQLRRVAKKKLRNTFRRDSTKVTKLSVSIGKRTMSVLSPVSHNELILQN
uniref:G-protein coupled receptors family 1 profile domain-containing protein n=1 Tax=Ditylenchus dipsaci TaxID=166011 RepID=A0A915E778_9BILA